MKDFKHQSFRLSLVIAGILFCTSCFEVVEEINLNNDGSGSFCFTINLSQSKLDINALMLLDSVNGRPVPKIDDLKNTFAKIETLLQQDSGLTNIKAVKNWDEYIFSISGNFKNIEALNKAINATYSQFGKTNGQDYNLKENFSFSQKVFKRLNNLNLVTDYHSLPEKEKQVFKTARYTAIYRFKSPVANYSNTEALKSKSGTSVMLKANISDILTNNKSIVNTIHLN